MLQTAETFAAFETNGVKALDIIRKRAFTPDLRKTLRTWGITEACEMIGRSVQTIRDLEKAKKIPSPRIDPGTSRRVYTLEHINKLREYFVVHALIGSTFNWIDISIYMVGGGIGFLGLRWYEGAKER